MIQKYSIIQDSDKNTLTINEYALLEKTNKYGVVTRYGDTDFTFVCKEEYSSDIIGEAVSKGINTIISAIRTDNLYPIEHHATRLADSIIDLYETEESTTVDLVFDDQELLQSDNRPD